MQENLFEAPGTVRPRSSSDAAPPCALCGAEDAYLDEIVTDNQGSRMYVCSDTDYCEGRQASGHRGSESAAPHKESAHG